MKQNKDPLGDTMKAYEEQYNNRILPNAFWGVRLDGRGFSKFTKKAEFTKPFDTRLITAMQNTTAKLVMNNSAFLGYTQSDEITLLFEPKERQFGGRVQKLCSTLAAEATVLFNNEFRDDPNVYTLLPTFDCRVFVFPSLEEALNMAVWREKDAVKNSIQGCAQTMFKHQELHKLNSSKLKEKMLKERNFDWNALPENRKRGQYFLRETVKTSVYEDNVDEIMKDIQFDPTKADIVRKTLLKQQWIERNQLQEMTSLLDIGQYKQLLRHFSS